MVSDRLGYSCLQFAGLAGVVWEGWEECDGEIPDHGLDVELGRALPLTPALLTRNLLDLKPRARRHKLEMQKVGNGAH